MAVIIPGTPSSFHAPPMNTTLYINGRKTYYTANMENVDGILAVTHGGTGNRTFKDGEVVIYSGGKLISSGVTKAELATLSGLSPGTSGGDTSSGGEQEPPKTLVDMLGEKVSTVTTSNGTPLDMDEETGTVKLPDYLLRTGGTIEGNLQVNGAFAVGNVSIIHDPITNCITFKVVE